MKPISIYIDTNILNDIAPKDKKWTETKWGKYLIELDHENKIEVFASPTNFLEIALNSDLDHRNNMAIALNTLIKGQRMAGTYEFYIVENLLSHIENNWQGSTNLSRFYFIKNASAHNYIALAGQMAALKDYNCSKGFSGIIKPKIITQIIQATIFENPKVELEKRLQAIRKKEYTAFDHFKAYDDKSIDELKTIQQTIESKHYQVDKKAVQWLKKYKDELIKGYMLDEVFSGLNQVFRYWEDMVNTINIPKIVTEWDKIYSLESSDRKYKPKPLPDEVKARYATATQNISDGFTVMRALAERFYHFLVIAEVYSYNVLNEMERALNAGKLPTGGLVLDSQHLIMPMYTEMFLCRDSRLLSSAKYWHGRMPKDQNVFRETASNFDEFKRKIERKINLPE